MKSRRVLFALFLLAFLQGESAKTFAQPAKVTADFGSRTGNLRHIPAKMFGVNPVLLQDPAALKLVSQAGFTEARRMADIPEVYATTTANWSVVDWNMGEMQAAGLHPIVVLALTPMWLQPSPNPCTGGVSGPENAPPTDVQKWAQLAASYVAHLDANYPGLVQEFEIWNEPELQKSFCVADNTDATRLRTYLNLYAAAATAMRAQATQDGISIRIGGPTIATMSLADEWLGAFLSDSRTAPNIDFVSFHLYLGNSSVTWNTLLSKTQGTQGARAVYAHVASLVAGGSQPDAASTPIFITEFNDDWESVADCCRNDPTYAPVWNSIFLMDVLNSAYAGAKLPARLYYFAGSDPPFCVLGKWDANMDCDGSQYDPYPQFYAFQLFAAADHIGLASGGQMAAAITSANSPAGLVTAAFLTDSQDIIVLINPTATPYSQVSLEAANAGFRSATATANLLNYDNPRISASPLLLKAVAGGFTAVTDVPAYSVLAVAISTGQAHDVSPTAVLSVSPQSGSSPLLVTADSSGSHDSDGSIVSRSIDFGDGSTPANSITATHTYNHLGTYVVLLTVTDNAGLISQTSASVIAAGPDSSNPDFSLAVAAVPPNGPTYRVTVTPSTSVDTPVSLSCPQAPQGMTCSFSPSSFTPGSKPASSVLTIATVRQASVAPELHNQMIGIGLAVWLAFPAVVLIGPGLSRNEARKNRLRILTFLPLMLLGLALQMGCVGATSQTTTNNAVQIMASSATHSHTITIYVGQ
jgi:PKD repeat protein